MEKAQTAGTASPKPPPSPEPLREHASIAPRTPEDIQRLLEWTEQFSFPSGDIEDILRETEAGRWTLLHFDKA